MKDETPPKTGAENRLPDRMVLVGGPPRSGTTFIAKSLIEKYPDAVKRLKEHDMLKPY